MMNKCVILLLLFSCKAFSCEECFNLYQLEINRIDETLDNDLEYSVEWENVEGWKIGYMRGLQVASDIYLNKHKNNFDL
jgi:hypothetical protein